MQDIFGSTSSGVQSWRLGRTVLVIPDIEGIIANSVQVTYQRGMSVQNPINTADKIVIVGEAAGQLSIGMLIGPSNGVKEFLKKYSDPCNIGGNTMTIRPVGDTRPCDGEFQPLVFKIGGVLLGSFQMTAQSAEAGGMPLTVGTVGGMFLTME